VVIVTIVVPVAVNFHTAVLAVTDRVEAVVAEVILKTAVFWRHPVEVEAARRAPIAIVLLGFSDL
jgi:hypothetical protein